MSSNWPKLSSLIQKTSNLSCLCLYVWSLLSRVIPCRLCLTFYMNRLTFFHSNCLFIKGLDTPGPEVTKIFVFNSAEHEIFSANKY